MDGLEEIEAILGAIDHRRKFNKIDYYKPYDFQLKFHHAKGHLSPGIADQRALMAGNQIGKSLCGGAETSYHLTGIYPEWWEGIRYNKPINAQCGSNTNEQTRDIVQSELFGDPVDDKSLGTGAVPLDCIGERNRKPGVPNAFDSVTVKHHGPDGHHDGWSKIVFRAYEQGAKKHMGSRIDWGWMDEEPPGDIWAQYLRGTFSTGGNLILTFTPEEGITDVVHTFMTDIKEGQALVRAGWDDAPHMTPENREKLLKQMRPHERDMRSKGIPTMGSGLVFPISDEDIMVEPFMIPAHWSRIYGLDIGWDHPSAVVSMAFDRETDTSYIYWCFRKEKALISTVASAIKSTQDGPWVPIAWPHDGMVKDKSSGRAIADLYRDQNLNMLLKPFSNPPAPGQQEGTGGQGVEAGIMAIYEAMEQGRFKVFSSCPDFFEEKGFYHRKEGKIVALRDDIMSATRYAYQSKRFADTRPMPRRVAAGGGHGLRNW